MAKATYFMKNVFFEGTIISHHTFYSSLDICSSAFVMSWNYVNASVAQWFCLWSFTRETRVQFPFTIYHFYDCFQQLSFFCSYFQLRGKIICHNEKIVSFQAKDYLITHTSLIDLTCQVRAIMPQVTTNQHRYWCYYTKVPFYV